jgi:hypothetical protein
MAEYWLGPCFNDRKHLVNCCTDGFLKALSTANNALREHVKDSFFTKSTKNFRVLCANMLGIGLKLGELPM